MARIVANPGPLMWAPVACNAANTVLVGSIVTDGSDGVIALGAAAGYNDKTGKTGTDVTTAGVPLGIVIGTNEEFADYSSTYKVNKTVSIITSNANFSRTRQGVEGPWGKGDKQAYVLIATITPETIIQCPLYASSLGTVPSVVTGASAASATGMGITTGAADVATVANYHTIYCRSGLNMGMYRIVATSHATVHTWTSPMPYATAVGDTFVFGPRAFGAARIQLDATSSFIDNSDALTTNWYSVLATKLDLSTAGACYLNFKFNAYAFVVESHAHDA